jgi:hypothetical protein
MLSLAAVQAQNYTIDWFTIDGGGGTSTGGVYTVSGTIGQPDANQQPLTGGSFSLPGGFWSLYAVQTPGAPQLSIRFTATNTVAVSWPSPSSGWSLYQNTNLTATNWTAVGTSPLDDGSHRTVIINPPTGNRYYRLIK